MTETVAVQPPVSSSSQSTRTAIFQDRPNLERFAIWPGGIEARPATEGLNCTTRLMCPTTQAPGSLGSVRPSPTHQDPSGACTTSRARRTPSPTARRTTAPKFDGNWPSGNGNGRSKKTSPHPCAWLPVTGPSCQSSPTVFVCGGGKSSTHTHRAGVSYLTVTSATARAPAAPASGASGGATGRATPSVVPATIARPTWATSHPGPHATIASTAPDLEYIGPPESPVTDAVRRRAVRHLWFSPAAAAARVDELDDLFTDVLTRRQRLP